MRSERQKARPAAIGMMFGMWIGGGIGLLAYAVTQDPIWFTLTGLGVAFGLGIGAEVEKRRADAPDPHEGPS